MGAWKSKFTLSSAALLPMRTNELCPGKVPGFRLASYPDAQFGCFPLPGFEFSDEFVVIPVGIRVGDHQLAPVWKAAEFVVVE